MRQKNPLPFANIMRQAALPAVLLLATLLRFFCLACQSFSRNGNPRFIQSVGAAPCNLVAKKSCIFWSMSF
jgi:hypothetical protein